MQIRTLDTVEAARELTDLIRDYVTFVAADLDATFGVAFDPEELLANTLGSLDKVVPPQGMTFVAEADDGTRLGMVFLRRSGEDAMEIKRLYVVPEGRGTGAGKALVLAAMDAAKVAGAKAMRLDTGRNLTAAIGLYESLGFQLRDVYEESDHATDEVLMPYLVFMERAL